MQGSKRVGLLIYLWNGPITT